MSTDRTISDARPLNAVSAVSEHRLRARVLVAACAAAFGLLGSGCSTVQPWERGNLADYTMRADRDPLAAAMSDHVYFSREGSTGGRGVGGGGCGCN